MNQVDGLGHLAGGNVLFAVGGVGDLVDVVADGGQLPEEGGVLVGWAGAEVDALYEISHKRVCSQSGQRRLSFQMLMLLVCQPHADVVISLSHDQGSFHKARLRPNSRRSFVFG